MRENIKTDAEDRLLPLLACRHLSDAQRRRTLSLLEGPLDWERILELCTQYKIYPMAHANLGAVRFHRVPPFVQERLRTMHRTNVLRNGQAIKELADVLTALHERGIPTIPMKGPALAQGLYRDVGLRAMSDLDVLVPPQFAEAALQALISIGYASIVPHYEAELRETAIETQLVKQTPVGRIVVELHWAILWTAKLDRAPLASLWSEARPAVIFGAQAFRMSPEWEILYLAAHVSKHHWEGLKWLADIHDLCATYEVNWAEVAAKARQFGWLTMLQTTFAACRQVFETAPPAEALRGRAPAWLRTFPETRDDASGRLLPLRWLDGLRPKLGYLTLILLVQKEGDWKYAHYLPRSMRFLYTPLRWVRLTAKFGPQLMRSLFQRSY